MKNIRRVATLENRQRVRLAFRIFLLVAFLWPMACGEASPPGESSRPGRIILVSMDTVRADHVTGYGVRETTPTLAEIAEEGVVLKSFYSASTYTLAQTQTN